ncbi:MAG: hypothetical protein QM733_04370 [Ilumatobacteraceae bacterium]
MSTGGADQRSISLPLTSPRAHPHGHRVRGTFDSYGGGLSGVIAAFGYVCCRVNGSIRVSADGTRWLSIDSPAHANLVRRNLALVVEVAVMLVALAALVFLVDSVPRRPGLIALGVQVAFVLCGTAAFVRHAWRTGRIADPAPPKPRGCVVIANLAKTPGAHASDVAAGASIGSELRDWLDRNQLTVRAMSSDQRLTRIYRHLLGTEPVGHASMLFQAELVEVLERRPHTASSDAAQPAS